MLAERSGAMIKGARFELNKPVRVVLFTSDVGCETCPDMIELARAVKARFGKIALEAYDIVMDRDKSDQYGVKRAPALVVQGAEGQAVIFYGMIEDVFLELFLSTIEAAANSRVWFPENIRRTLGHLTNDVSLRVFVESDCQQCRPVAETAIGLAFENKLISTSIIMANDFPDLIKKYHISTLPKTIFGENLHLDGHVTESMFLEMVFQAEGVKAGPERKCLICGTASPDIICANCRTKIQAEAVNHKLKTERMKSPESP